jgi:hypothetical protein
MKSARSLKTKTGQKRSSSSFTEKDLPSWAGLFACTDYFSFFQKLSASSGTANDQT